MWRKNREQERLSEDEERLIQVMDTSYEIGYEANCFFLF